MSPARVRLDASRLQRFLRAVGGPGERLLTRKAERVRDLAKVYSAHNGSIPEGIIVGPYRDGSIEVISTNPNTEFVHNGTPRHLIRPRRANGMLRFRMNGQVVFARVVNHPGYEGNPFLTDALRDVQ